MNEYSKYVEEYISKEERKSSFDVSKLNNIRRKFGKKELIKPSKNLIKINSLYYITGSLFIFIILIAITISKKPHVDQIIVKKENIPIINTQEHNLSIDDQALYWAYAIYDFEKFSKTFSVNKDISLNHFTSRKNLMFILPKVSPSTLEKIYTYDNEILNSLVKEPQYGN